MLAIVHRDHLLTSNTGCTLAVSSFDMVMKELVFQRTRYVNRLERDDVEVREKGACVRNSGIL